MGFLETWTADPDADEDEDADADAGAGAQREAQRPDISGNKWLASQLAVDCLAQAKNK